MLEPRANVARGAIALLGLFGLGTTVAASAQEDEPAAEEDPSTEVDEGSDAEDEATDDRGRCHPDDHEPGNHGPGHEPGDRHRPDHESPQDEPGNRPDG